VEKTQEAALMDSVEEIDDTALQVIPAEKRKPLIHEYGWTDHVLAQLDDKDFIEHKGKKFPKTDALYRILPVVLGVEVIESSSHFIHRSDDGTVTVEHTLVLENESYQKKYVGLCDVSAGNMDPPFNKYLAANGSTRAKGRAIRDALVLRVCVAEELSNVAEEEYEKEKEGGLASTVQKAGIKSLCKRVGVDPELLLKRSRDKPKSWQELKYTTAQNMMDYLNLWQQNKEDIPPALLIERSA
jgi:hypothetical protein